MAETEHTIVICYDIARDRTRRRVSTFLEERLVRVQESVFEGRLPLKRAYQMFEALGAMTDDEDLLRLYVMTQDGLEKSRVHGGAPLPEIEGFYLL